MGKIMYLEDQPDSAFIINVFGMLLNPQEIKKLKESENDPYELHQAVKDNMVFELVTDFSVALKRLEKGLLHYDLLIVDRDLYDNGLKYNPADLIKTDPEFKEDYHKREGDFLIGYCYKNKYDIDNRFYIFTGNTDELQLSSELRFILSDHFKSENVIVKGSEGKNKLIRIIKSLPDLELEVKNTQYLKILKEMPSEKEDFSELFFKLLKSNENHESLNIKDQLNLIRNILEEILTESARNFRVPQHYWTKGSLNCTKYITKYLSDYNNLEDKPIFRHETSSVIIEAMSTIYRISSQFGAHNSKGFKPTQDTVSSLIFGLKDIISWYGDVVKRSGK